MIGRSIQSGIATVGVIGAGVMGRAISAANLERGIRVVLTDTDAGTLQSAAAELSETQHTNRGNFHTATSHDELAEADLIIEAITERLSAKQQVLGNAERVAKPGAILASNTSSIPISRIAEGLTRPQLFCGMHFCHPVRRRPLVEIVRGATTGCDTIAAAIEHANALGKTPVVVGDCPGFVVNRLLSPYLNESLELILEGAEPEIVEAAARAFGMPIGPLRQFDEYGIDISVRTGALLRSAYSDRALASELPVLLYGMGRLGRKTGAGFYSYCTDRRKQSDDSFNELPTGPLDAEVRRMFEEHRRGLRTFSPGEITMRLFLPMLLEATRILEEQVATDAASIDTALAGGLGFLPLEGGLLRWADTVGPRRILAALKPLAPLGKRFEPTTSLREMAKASHGFYDKIGANSAPTRAA